MGKGSDLRQKMEAHQDSMRAKIDAIERTHEPIPQQELERDIAITIELNQQYIDLLDEFRDRIASEGIDL